MSSYRKTMGEAMQEVNAFSQERQDKNLLENVLMGTLKDNQLANLKKVWANKSMKDVTPGLKATIAKMDMPTKVAIAGAEINVLKDIVFKEEDAYDKDDEKPKTKPKPKKLQASYEEVELQAILDEKFTVQITKKDGSTMELGRYNTSHEAQRYVDMYGKGAKVVKEENFHEGKMSQIYAMDQDGASAEEIAKALKVSTKTVEDILGEDKKDLDESFSPAMLQKLKTEFGPLKGKTINAAQARQLMNILDKLNDILNKFKENNINDEKIECLLPDNLHELIEKNQLVMTFFEITNEILGITNPGDEVILKDTFRKDTFRKSIAKFA